MPHFPVMFTAVAAAVAAQLFEHVFGCSCLMFAFYVLCLSCRPVVSLGIRFCVIVPAHRFELAQDALPAGLAQALTTHARTHTHTHTHTRMHAVSRKLHCFASLQRCRCGLGHLLR